jgi:hypothetical protein
MQAADRLIGYFPRSAASDPRVFMTGLVDLLSEYPAFAVEAVLSVRGGIPAKHEMMPAISQIREALEAESRVARYAQEWRDGARQALLPGPPAPPRPTYDDLKAKYGDNWGLKPDGPKTPAFSSLEDIAAKFGVSRDVIDALPDAPVRKTSIGDAARKIISR